MNLLDRYIFRVVLGSTLVVLVVLLILDTFFSLLDELGRTGTGDYGLTAVLYYLMLGVPGQIYETLPVALLVGGLLGMGGLANHSELVVMRSAGRSVLRIVGSALQAGLVLSVLALLLGEFVAPYTDRLAKDYRFTARTGNTMLYPGYSFWARDGGAIVGIGTILPGPVLVDVAIYSLDESARLRQLTQAQRAHYADGYWHLEQVTERQISPQHIDIVQQDQGQWHSVVTPQTLEVLAADPADLAIRETLTYIAYLEENGLDTRPYELAFWTKVVAPLANLAMLFIAMPFAFSQQRSISTGQRLVIGILIGLLFYLLNRLLGNVVLLYGLPPLLGACLPMLLLYSIGFWALSRGR